MISLILNILKNYNINPNDTEDEALLYHRVTEALKWAYGQRSRLGDPFDKEIENEIWQA